jgi:hypothetical protein
MKVTVNVIVAVWVNTPSVPVMVTGNVPVLALADAAILSVDVAAGLGVTGVVSEQVTPVGQPVTARPTTPLYPFNAVTVTGEAAVPPCASVNDDGIAETRKFGDVDTLA